MAVNVAKGAVVGMVDDVKTTGRLIGKAVTDSKHFSNADAEQLATAASTPR